MRGSTQNKKGVPGALRSGDTVKKAGGCLLSRFRSTIGAAGLNFSVRDGKRWCPGAMAAINSKRHKGQCEHRRRLRRAERGGLPPLKGPHARGLRISVNASACFMLRPRTLSRKPRFRQARRPLSPSRRSLRRGVTAARRQAFGQLVGLGFGVAAFTPAPYQRRRLRRPSKGCLISGPASRLDAFSAYPIPAWLPCGAPGGTTGRPEAGPARSSRTSARAPQTSDARDR